MRTFLFACFAIIAVGAGGYFFLDSMQESTGAAFTTDGARINQKWTWRAMHDLMNKAAKRGGLTITQAIGPEY